MVLPQIQNIGNEDLIIETLCEKVMLVSVENKEKMRTDIIDKATSLVRFLDPKTTLPLNLVNVDDLPPEGISEDEIDALTEANKSVEEDWKSYTQTHPFGTARQFLSTSDYGECRRVFDAIAENRTPKIRKPLLKFFSEEDRNYLESLHIKKKENQFDKIIPENKKGNYSTSFYACYAKSGENGNYVFSCSDPSAVKQQIMKQGLAGNHTGFAIGDLKEKEGLFEVKPLPNETITNRSLSHLGFWRWRTNYNDILNISNKFTFFDL